MKKWPLILATLIIVAILTALIYWWDMWRLTWLFAFLTDDANSAFIQTLANALQIVIWLFTAVVSVVGLRWAWRQDPAPPAKQVTVKDRGTLIDHSGSGSQEINTARSDSGPVFSGVKDSVIVAAADPRQLWQAISHKAPSPDLKRATDDYLQYLVARYRYLDFKGMGVSDRVALRMPLIEMYVPLKARVEVPEGETWGRHLRLAGRQASETELEAIGQRLSEPQPVLDLLQKQKGLIILGDPGAGKTTFLKYLALQLAAGQGERLGLGQRLPILLPLSAYANALAEADVPLDDFIAAYYRDRGIDFPLGPMLMKALAEGGALLLLDGLDEVKALDRRHLVVDRVVDFFSRHQRAGNKFILTSRIVGYRDVRRTIEGMTECTLVDFEHEEINDFVAKWTAAVERAAHGQTTAAAQEAAQERQELLAAVERNPGVRSLAANPLLLTILALMKRQGITLPERRVELYQKYIETLLKHWNLARGLGRPPSRDLDVVETVRVLAPLALWMHQTSPGVGLVKQAEMQRRLTRIYQERGSPEPEAAARQLLADARDHASLLLERGAGEYGFIHLTFQEYLAAVAIAQQGQRGIKPVVKLLGGGIGDDNWREVTLLTVGYIGIIQQRDEAAGAVVRALLNHSPPAAVLAGEAVADAEPSGVDAASKATVIRALEATLAADRQVEAPVRAAAGAALARLGDSRPGVGVRADGLPDIEWREVQAGEFLMGSDPKKDKEAQDREQPQHTVTLPAYKISRYPITNAQYQTFVRSGGYTDRWQHCWTKKGWDWKGDRLGPEMYGGTFDLPNHPAVMITWYEAVAFCRWLTDTLRDRGELDKLQTIRLPTEAEWEKAARGPSPQPSPRGRGSQASPPQGGIEGGQIYPWGEEADPNKANYDETGLNSTSAVGCFPGGASPDGCQEMSGNVWEWCSTIWDEEAYPYQIKDEWDGDYLNRTNVPLRVLRGGAFYSFEEYVRCAVRDGDDPVDRNWNFGFRVVLSPFTSGL